MKHINVFPKIVKSTELLHRAEALIPCATQTLAKGPSQHSRGVMPAYLTHGKGSHVWDADRNEYLDLTMAVGPLSLGYCYPRVDEAIRSQLAKGITFSLMHPLEVEVAELIHAVVPNAESVRFSKTGADATSAAIRLARAYTGKNTILCSGYHGWHDWYIGITDRSNGIPDEVQNLTYTFKYNDIQSVLDSIDDDTAAIILEPTVFEEPRDNFLHKLRDICTEHGIVLIFDEMWTGFRLALGGAQEYFGIKADLACFSKAVANGMPLSVLTGKREIMQLLEKDVFFFTTFGGEALSLAAAHATISELRDNNVATYLERQGRKIKDGYNQLAAKLGMDYTKCVGFECRTMLTFAPSAGNPLEMKTFIQQELLRRGILWNGFHTLSFSHSNEDIEHILRVYGEVLPLLKLAIETGTLREQLRGEVLQEVFRKTSNFNIKQKI